MYTVYKCKSCECGPCYCATANVDQPNEFGDCHPQPDICPYFGKNESPEFEMCAPEIRPNSPKWLDAMQEWINGDGYEKAPEKLRDAVMACSMVPVGLYSIDMIRVYNLLREAEEGIFCGFMELEDFDKALKKLTKKELIAAIFPEAFKAGIAYAEYVRQEKYVNPEFPEI